jgi:MFS family permease
MSGTSIDTKCAKFGPVWLAPGVSRANMSTLLYAAFFTIGLITFIGVGTPYVLTAILKIPADQQGSVSGNLVFWNEITALLVYGPVGILADKYGRKALYVFGFTLMALGIALYPTADSVAELTIYRIIFAIGTVTASGVLATVVSDYPQEATRGKLVAITGFMNGFGVAVISALFGGIPKRFSDAGFDEVTAGLYTHWIVAVLCVISAVVVSLGLKSGLPGKTTERLPISEIISGAVKATANPRIALSYSAAFIARGDLVIIGIFVILWGTNAGVASGLAVGEATSKATFVFVMSQVSSLIWIGIAVFLLDRFNRVTGLAWCMLLATLGYLGMGLVDNPLSPDSLPFVLLLGIGTISAFLGSQTLIGQEAPERQRGAVVSGFNLSGAVGILFCSIVGGQLFDAISPKAPFLLVGALNGVVFVLCIIVRLKAPGRMPEARSG